MFDNDFVKIIIIDFGKNGRMEIGIIIFFGPPFEVTVWPHSMLKKTVRHSDFFHFYVISR